MQKYLKYLKYLLNETNLHFDFIPSFDKKAHTIKKIYLVLKSPKITRLKCPEAFQEITSSLSNPSKLNLIQELNMHNLIIIPTILSIILFRLPLF